MSKEILKLIVIVLLASVIGGVVAGLVGNQPASNPFGGSTSDNWNVGGNLTVAGTSSLTGNLSLTGATTLAELTQGGGTLTVATTAATYALSASQLATNHVIYIQSVAGAAALALTLPATSTMTSLIPSDSQSRTWYIYNAHTAAATTTTVTAGTGIDLQGDTANDDVINGGGILGTLQCFRLPDTNVVCSVSEKVVVD